MPVCFLHKISSNPFGVLCPHVLLSIFNVLYYIIYLLDLLDLPVLLSHCVAFMTDLNVGQIINNTNSLVLVQF